MKKLLSAAFAAITFLWAPLAFPAADVRNPATNISGNAATATALASGQTANGTLRTDSAGTPTIDVKPDGPFWHNLSFVTATTTTTGDSIKVQCGAATCSASNSGWIDVPSIVTAGASTRFPITADVTIKVTGADFGLSINSTTVGDIVGQVLRFGADNDNGSLRWCVVLLGGRTTLLTTDTTSTATSATLGESALCNTAVGSATNTFKEVGWWRSDFDDTGGSAENLWANQTSVVDWRFDGIPACNVQSPWSPGFTGFSANPTGTYRWGMCDREITVESTGQTAGTSNATTFTMTNLPGKAFNASAFSTGSCTDNTTALTTPCRAITATASKTLTMGKDLTGAAWTGSGTKQANFTVTYDAGPAASYLE